LTDSYDGYKTCRVIVSGIEANTTYYYTYGTGNLVYGPYLYRSLGFDNFKFFTSTICTPATMRTIPRLGAIGV
jgi:hypothetical protein